MTATLISAHYVLKIERGTPSVVRVCDDWTVAVSHQMVCTDQRLDAEVPAHELHYVVRQYNDTDGLVRRALDVKLSPKQGEALDQLHKWFKRNPYKTWVRPGRDRTWSGMYSGDMVAPCKVLADRELLRVTGVPYGPKSYRLTKLGRFVAEHRRNTNPEVKGT